MQYLHTGFADRLGSVAVPRILSSVGIHEWDKTASAAAFKEEVLWVLHSAHYKILGWFGKYL